MMVAMIAGIHTLFEDRRRRRLVWAAVAVVFSAIVVWLEGLYEEGRPHHVEARIHAWFQTMRAEGGKGGTLNVLMDQVTALGGEAVLAILTVGGAVFLATVRRHALMLFWIAAVILGRALNIALKYLTAHARPGEAAVLIGIENDSFPSGHAMMSLVVYLLAAVLLVPHVPTRRGRIFLVVFALWLSIVVGFSRLHLGVHVLSDVVAGWLVGGAWVALCWTARDVILSRRQI
ncbi:MAG: phosphatase PAP2 family protein [Planctomycetaceae bacterium]